MDISPAIRPPTRLQRVGHPSPHTEVTTVVNADASVILGCFPRNLERRRLWLRTPKHLIECLPRPNKEVSRG